jgi:DNA-binding NarL/FixJ family response regulator
MAADSIIHVVIADDHNLFLEGLSRLLCEEKDIQIDATAKNGLEAVAAVDEHRPDILLLDIDMPDISGFKVVKKLEQKQISVKTILLTIHSETPYLIAASQKNIHGFILKDAAFEDLVKAIHNVHKGKRYFSSQLHSNLLVKKTLSKRELAVLTCAGNGMTIKETAQKLNLSNKTVEYHRSKIILKLGVRNITEAVHCFDL